MGQLDRALALARRGLDAVDQHAQAGERVGLGGRVAEVAGQHGGVGLDGRPGGRDAGDAGGVLAAELDPVERVLDRLAGGRQVAGAALELRPQRAADAQELRLERVGEGLVRGFQPATAPRHPRRARAPARRAGDGR